MSAYSLVCAPGSVAIPLRCTDDALLPLQPDAEVRGFGIMLIANHFRRRTTR